MSHAVQHYRDKQAVRVRTDGVAWGLLLTLLLVTPSPRATDVGAMRVPSGHYTIESQMVLPHLDEMRRISEQTEACFDHGDARAFFPVFAQPALGGCRLDEVSNDADSVTYRLVCDSVNGASGTASLRAKDAGIRAVLEAKMGGKNMTFAQYVSAHRIGACTDPATTPMP